MRDEQRFCGYCDAMNQHQLEAYRINPRASSSIYLGRSSWPKPLNPTRILMVFFARNDDIAMGALFYCRERSLFRNAFPSPAFMAWKWGNR
jgi:LacI family gluconate utilization system Gnt-II transcriptional activator